MQSSKTDKYDASLLVTFKVSMVVHSIRCTKHDSWLAMNNCKSNTFEKYLIKYLNN